jgi:hypothetical protein
MYEARVLMQYVEQARDEGYAIVVITPDELGNAGPRKVEERLVGLSWSIVSDLDR